MGENITHLNGFALRAGGLKQIGNRAAGAARSLDDEISSGKSRREDMPSTVP